MSSLASLYIKKDTLQALLADTRLANEKGIELTLSINDDSNDYGQNLTAYVSQTQEERTNKERKTYIGNGKVFWTNGKIHVGQKVEQQNVNAQTVSAKDEPPF